jgi:hypothetical protein
LVSRVETQVIYKYWKKPGHYKADCFKLLRKNQHSGKSIQRNGVASPTTDIVLSAINSHESFKNTSIDESGASCHYCNSHEGLFEQAIISEMNAVGNGSTMKAEQVGKLRSCVLQCGGRKFEITSENIEVMPDLWINLFINNKALMYGFIMVGNEGVLLKLTKEETTLLFDQRLNTKVGFKSGIKMVSILKEVVNTAVGSYCMIKFMSFLLDKLHKILGPLCRTVIEAQ